MNTPTPRTDSAWAKTFEDDEDQCRAGNAATDMRDACATFERELETEKTNRNFFIEKGATLERELGALTAERDQLRAEVERFKFLHQCESESSVAEFARAYRAEAELAAEREKAERYRLATLKLDAELATERARLDSGQIMLIVAGQRVWHCGVDLRAAIDAAIKEDAK